MPAKIGKQRHAQREFPDLQAALRDGQPDDGSDGCHHDPTGDQPNGSRRIGKIGPEHARMKRKARQPHQRQADPERDRDIARDGGNLQRVKPGHRIDPIAHGPARDCADPDGITEGIAQKAANADKIGRQRFADEAQPEPVIEDQRAITGRRRRKRRDQGPKRHGPDLRHDIRRIDRTQQVIKRVKPEPEQRHAQKNGHGAPQGL